MCWSAGRRQETFVMTTLLPRIARVIEIGDVTAGIVVPEGDGTVRFFSAQRQFDRLDRRLFRQIDLVTKAVRELLHSKRHAVCTISLKPERTDITALSE